MLKSIWYILLGPPKKIVINGRLTELEVDLIEYVTYFKKLNLRYLAFARQAFPLLG